MNNVLENNNRQIGIYKIKNEKINEVLKNTNKRSKLVMEQKEVKNYVIQVLQTRDIKQRIN